MRGILIAVLMLLVMSCTTQRVIEVPVERVRTDSVYLTKLQRDTLVERDSVVMQIVGDTVLRLKTDTVTKVVTVEKERKRTMGDYTWGIALAIIGALVLVGYVKRR